MLKKTFVLTMFGTPFPWIQEFIDHVQHLEKYGWYWKVFTANEIPSKGNVEIVPMTPDEFNDLVEKKLGVRSNMFMTPRGVPSVHVTDFYVATGLIFEDWLKDSDFWGITNLDVVYGRLDHFLPDSKLENLDIFTDDVDRVVNGVFSLYRNIPEVNNLCKQIPDWLTKVSQPPCGKCMGDTLSLQHTLYGTDEYDLTRILAASSLRIGDCEYYPLHSHDRLENHIPDIKLKIHEDGSLWELLKDVAGPNWIHARPFIGREVMYFHFQKSKAWPLCLK